MGIMGGLNAEEYDRNYSDRELARRVTAYFRPQIRKWDRAGPALWSR